MSEKRMQRIERRIEGIKKALLEIGSMRPGSLTRQMKSRTEYVRREWVKELRRQIATQKRFKRLVDQWIDLSIKQSKLAMQIADPKKT